MFTVRASVPETGPEPEVLRPDMKLRVTVAQGNWLLHDVPMVPVIGAKGAAPAIVKPAGAVMVSDLMVELPDERFQIVALRVVAVEVVCSDPMSMVNCFWVDAAPLGKENAAKASAVRKESLVRMLLIGFSWDSVAVAVTLAEQVAVRMTGAP